MIYRFGQLFEIIDGDRGKNYPNDSDFLSEGYCLFLNAGNVTKTGWSFENNMFISKEKDELLRKGRVQRGNTVFTTRGTVGNAAYFDEKVPFDHLRINSGMVILSAKNNEVIDNEFIYYLVTSPIAKKTIEQFCSGSAQPQLPIKDFIKIKYDLPSIETQRKIISILSAYDNLIEVNNKRIRVLERMAENLYKEWFVRFRFPGHESAEFENGIPKGWEEKKLGQFGISLDSGSRPSGGVDNSLEDGMPSLGAESINSLGEFDYSSVRLIPIDYYNQMKRGKNTGRDILVYKDGAYIGKTTIFMNGFPYTNFAINEHVFLLNAIERDYQFYLYFTLHLPEYFATMQNLNRNAAQPGLSKQDMYCIKIIVPEREVVRLFNRVVEPILNQIFELATQTQNLIKQRDLLLPRLMSGKMEV